MTKGTADQDYAPLLVGDEENRRAVPRRKAEYRVAVTVSYCFIMIINGGGCGAFGPSLEAFERTTGLSQAVLGGAVMQNRLAKLAGTVVWGYFASRIQRQRPGEALLLPQHFLMALSLLISAGCSAVSAFCPGHYPRLRMPPHPPRLSALRVRDWSQVLGYTRSGTTLQLMMVLSGFAYGITDSGANLLILWVWHHDTSRQRVNVAVLNAMFTIGAFVTPMLIAASMHYMRGHIWPAYYAIAVIAILQVVATLQLFSPCPCPCCHLMCTCLSYTHACPSVCLFPHACLDAPSARGRRACSPYCRVHLRRTRIPIQTGRLVWAQSW